MEIFHELCFTPLSHDHVNCYDKVNPSHITSVSKPYFLNPAMFYSKMRTYMACLVICYGLFLFSFSEMTKLLQVAVPVVLAILCLIPTVDAPTRTGMYMQMNINTRKMFYYCERGWVSTWYPSECEFSVLLLSALKKSSRRFHSLYPQILLSNCAHHGTRRSRLLFLWIATAKVF